MSSDEQDTPQPSVPVFCPACGAPMMQLAIAEIESGEDTQTRQLSDLFRAIEDAYKPMAGEGVDHAG